MIDQAKHNLSTPVKMKFNGILSKYVEGIRKRELKDLEIKNRKGTESPNCSYYNFSRMSEAD